MTLPPSDSESAVEGVSTAFARLDARVQRWIWEQNWSELRDIQEDTIHAILDTDDDIILSSPTASGKTEAAFLPLCSQIVDEAANGIRLLYISPLKALINDQFTRLDHLCEQLAIPVHRWHGDVQAGRKHALLNNPSGIVLITPESLETLFVLRGSEIVRLFSGLQCVVLDEMHIFIGMERGRQVQSLLHRIETAIGRRVRRIGLSATLSDMALSADFLRPQHAEDVTIIASRAAGQELKIQLRGYVEQADNASNFPIAAHLFETLRGTDNLIFPNQRHKVEMYADMLREMCECNGVTNVFLPHHGNLSKTLREEAETRLKDKSQPVSLICTTTLEMGIDVGSVHSIAQIGVPPTVSSLRQRVGRSGRRGNPAILRVYVTEHAIDNRTLPQDAIRADLVEAIVKIQLMLQGWIEPPPVHAPHPSTLVQQTLSLIAQHSGAQAADLWSVLCGTGPFLAIDQGTYARFLRVLAQHDLIMQMPDGTLLLGRQGERIVNNYHFYAAFSHSIEFRLEADGKTIGTLPAVRPPAPEEFILFAGQRWLVISVDVDRKLITLVSSKEPGAVRFDGEGGMVHDRVRQEMFALYMSVGVPNFLDTGARELLAEGRRQFTRYDLGRQSLVPYNQDTLLFCWRGDAVAHTLAAQLRCLGFAVIEEGYALTVFRTQPPKLIAALQRLAVQGQVAAESLFPFCDDLCKQKHDCFVSPELLGIQYAARYLDMQGTADAIAAILSTF
jgi:ATP-dependent Lhr-like helicase